MAEKESAPVRLLVFLFMMSMIGCVCLALGEDLQLTILHTNDVHARVFQTNKYTSRCTEEDAAADRCYGGVARRATAVHKIRRNHSNVLLLDAGDQFQGTLWFTYYNGSEASYFMNQLGYDAMALGNHEFDNGVDGLANPFLQQVNFPVLSANLDVSAEPKMRTVQKSTVLEVDGQKIGVVGYTTEETSFLVDADGIRTLQYLDVVSSVRDEVTRLKSEGVNKIIALGHAGIYLDEKLAREVDDIDVIIGGHTNTFLYNGEPPSIEKPYGPYPMVHEKDNGHKTLMVQAFAYGKYLGYLTVVFDDEGLIKDFSGNPILLDGSIPEDRRVKAEVDRWRQPLIAFSSAEVGESYVLLQGGEQFCRTGECSLGNLVTDAVLFGHLSGPDSKGWSKCAIAVWNGGAIRTSITQGKVTIENVLEAMPFRNEVELVEIPGHVLKAVLEASVSQYEFVVGRFLQVAGIKVTYDVSRPPGQRVVDVMVRCTACQTPRYEPLMEEEYYALFTSTYIVKGGDDYGIITKNARRREYFGNLASDELREYIEQHSPIIAGLEGRITILNQP